MILSKKYYQHHGFLKGILICMKITLWSFLRVLIGADKRITIQYPDEKYQYSNRYRGLLALTLKSDNSLRCTACMLCKQICPSQCIHIEPAEGATEHDQKAPALFNVEILRCMFCGLCEEACPVDGIRLTSENELSGYASNDWLMGIEELAFRKSLFGGKGIYSKVDDKNRAMIRI